MDHFGWRSRGYLPHFHAPGLVQAINFRLYDALPQHVVVELEEEAKRLPTHEQEAELRRLKDRYLDKGYGACWLRRKEVAKVVEDSMLATDGAECLLLAWSIMPNHVHAVVELADDISLSDLLKCWKGPTARAANVILGRSGTFWLAEYFDRFIRDQQHLVNEIRYVDMNPVKAGLCNEARDWPFGSARFARDAD